MPQKGNFLQRLGLVFKPQIAQIIALLERSEQDIAMSDEQKMIFIQNLDKIIANSKTSQRDRIIEISLKTIKEITITDDLRESFFVTASQYFQDSTKQGNEDLSYKIYQTFDEIGIRGNKKADLINKVREYLFEASSVGKLEIVQNILKMLKGLKVEMFVLVPCEQSYGQSLGIASQNGCAEVVQNILEQFLDKISMPILIDSLQSTSNIEVVQLLLNGAKLVDATKAQKQSLREILNVNLLANFDESAKKSLIAKMVIFEYLFLDHNIFRIHENHDELISQILGSKKFQQFNISLDDDFFKNCLKKELWIEGRISLEILKLREEYIAIISSSTGILKNLSKIIFQYYQEKFNLSELFLARKSLETRYEQNAFLVVEDYLNLDSPISGFSSSTSSSLYLSPTSSSDVFFGGSQNQLPSPSPRNSMVGVSPTHNQK